MLQAIFDDVVQHFYILIMNRHGNKLSPSLPPCSLWPLKSLNVSRSGSTARCGQQQSTQLGGDTQGAAARSTGETRGHQPPELFSFECRGVSNQYNSRCCLFIFRKVWTSCQQIVTNLTFFNFQNIMRVSARDRAVCSVVRAATNCRVIVLVFDT